MKNIISIVVIIIAFTGFSQAQQTTKKMSDAPTIISLAQTPGEFTEKTITVAPGSYIFEIENQQAGTDVGFVLIKKGDDASNPENHIQTAYVTQVVKEGTTERSNTTVLTSGSYEYFCPLNKTEMNILVVE